MKEKVMVNLFLAVGLVVLAIAAFIRASIIPADNVSKEQLQTEGTYLTENWR